MTKEYQLLAIDNLTGKIFPPDVEFGQGGRILKDEDKTTVAYYYTQPAPGIIDLPQGYEVLPIDMLIDNRQNLSAEANGVIEKTRQALFGPVKQKIVEALRKNTDPRVLRELSTILKKVEAA